VIVTGRGHVEGGKGVPWQVGQLLPDARVESFVLAWGQAPCHPGDQAYKPGLFEKR
jgi:hypothetical protein